VPDALALAWEPAVRLTADGVLFVCTANSARSQLAAALWNAHHHVPASSAGTAPAGAVHPEAVKAGARAGLNLGEAVPRSLDELPGLPDLIVTVCDRAHEELAHRPPNRLILHWSIPDPAEDCRPAAFDLTVRCLSDRIGALVPHVTRPPGRRARPRRSRP
jgi:protein-tyrosine-phosphatase